MTHGWWKIKTENLDPMKCLVFPKYQGTDYEATELDSTGKIDLELFDEVIESTIKLNDVDREHIVKLVKEGYVEGEVVQ